MHRPEIPVAMTDPRAARARRRGVLSLVTFFAQAKKRFSTAVGWSSDSRVSANPLLKGKAGMANSMSLVEYSDKSPMDPSVRWDDGFILSR